MQLFPCPFCGPRDEREFSYAGDFGKTRPDTTGNVSAEEWSAYMFTQKNKMGVADEIWVHLPCQEYFKMTRDTVTMEVLSSEPLRKDTP